MSANRSWIEDTLAYKPHESVPYNFDFSPPARKLVGMIDIGLDVLHPIQPEAMDPVELKSDFRKQFTLCGGLRTQDLLPRGSVREVRDEVRRLKEQLGRDGGYILEPGITTQADVPADNLIAMIEEAINNVAPQSVFNPCVHLIPYASAWHLGAENKGHEQESRVTQTRSTVAQASCL